MTSPRLLNLRDAAAYCGISLWTMRDLVLAKHVPTVCLPAQRPRAGAAARHTLRRVLIDKHDLDRFIDARKSVA